MRRGVGGPPRPALRHRLAAYLERIRSNDPTCVEVQLASEGKDVLEGITDQHVQELAGALRANRHTREIHAWGNSGITDTGAEVLLDLLIDNTFLDRINLDITSVSEKMREKIQQQLIVRCLQSVSEENPDKKHVHMLDLSRRNLNDENVKQTVQILWNNPFVTSLSLWGNPRVTDEGLKHLLDMLHAKEFLIAISLEGTGASAQMQREIAARINQSRCHKSLSQAMDPRIISINLSNSSLSNEGLADLVQAMQGNHRLTSLLLTGNPSITADCADRLLSALDEVPYLATLAIDSHRWNENTKARWRKWKIDRMTNLILLNTETFTKVDFSSCPLRDQEWPAIINALRGNSAVVSLNLGESKLSESSLRRLLELIPTHASLARVSTDRLKSSDAVSGGDASKELRKGGSVSTDLRNLISKTLRDRTLERARQSLLTGSVIHLEELQYIDVCDKDLIALAPVVAQSTSLTALTLRCGENLSYQGISSLLGDVRQKICNTRLTRLNLMHTPQSGVSLQDRKNLDRIVGTRAVSHAFNKIQEELRHCVIDLSGQGVQDDAIIQMCSFIQKRSVFNTLELDLSHNPITNRSALAILELIENFPSVLRVDLRGSSATGALRRKIGDVLRKRATGYALRLLVSSFHPPLLRRNLSMDFLHSQELSDAEGLMIADAMCNGNMVEEINLSTNIGLTDITGERMLEAIKSKSSNIHTMHLQGTSISSKLAAMIQKQLDKNAHRICLTELTANASQRASIHYLRARGLTDSDVTKIARALIMNTTIQKIDFSGNIGISDASIRALEAAVTNKEYAGIASTFTFKGTRTSEEAVKRLHKLLQPRTSQDKPGSHKALHSRSESAPSTRQPAISTKDSSQWFKIRDEIHNVQQLIVDMVSALELENEGISSSALLDIPMLSPFILNTAQRSSMTRDIPDTGGSSGTISQDQRGKGIMELKSIGVRLKFADSNVQLTKQGLALALGIPGHSVQVYTSRFDLLVVDVRLYDVVLNPNASQSSADETCDQVAARLFTHCQDSAGSFCRQYNRGREIFCHYPWALVEDLDKQAMQVAMISSSNLESYIPQVMKPGCTEWESKLQRVFSGACFDLSQALSSQIFQSADIKRICEQFVVQALMQLEKAAIKSSSLQRYISPDEEHSKFLDANQKCKELCHAFLHFVRWITGGGKTKVPVGDPDIEAALMGQWSHLQNFLERLRQDESSLKGLESDVDPGFISSLETQEKNAHDTAKLLQTRCKESLVAVGADLTDLGAEKVRRVGEINSALLQIREKRQKLAKQLERTTTARHHDMIEIQQYLKSYTENSKKIIALSKQDAELARAERDIENDAAIHNIDTQLTGLLSTQKDWKQGLEVAATLETSVQKLSSEVRSLIEFEHNRLDRGIRELSLKLFKDSFYPVYVLSLLEIERLKYSIAIDRAEADRATSWSDIYHPVGKLRKPRQAQNTWMSSAVQPHTLLAPSPYAPGSSGSTSWGASYERQCNSIPVLTQLVLDMPFHTIEANMEAFHDSLRIDLSTALDCNIERVAVHSVVAGSVIVTLSFLPDSDPVQDARSPIDLMSELVRQAVDISSVLRAGKYTRVIKEVKHVPDSMADQSVPDQELRVASIIDVCDRIEKHSEDVWTGMKQTKSAIPICHGTDTELLVFRDTDENRHVSIPHYRLVKPVISYEEFIDEGKVDWNRDFISDYFMGIEKQMRVACAASKQFAIEYKDVAIANKRAHDNVIRLRDLESKYNSNFKKADRELQRREEKERRAEAKLESIQMEAQREEHLLKLAADAVIKGGKELAQRRNDLHRSEDELFDVKCLECNVVTTMAVPHAESRIVKTQRLYQFAFAGLYFAIWRRGVRENALERVNITIAPAKQLLNDLQRAKNIAQNELKIAQQDRMSIEKSLEEEKYAAAQRKHVLDAYRYISDSAPPQDEVDGAIHWIIVRTHLAYRTKVQLTVGAPFDQVSRDLDSKAKFITAINEGILNLLTGPGAEKTVQEDVQKRLEVLDVMSAMTGHTIVRFCLLRDQPDFSSRVDSMLRNLRKDLMPTTAGAVPVQLPSGMGADGSSTVHKLEIHDPLGCGQLGEVREADYEGRHVVVKSIHFKGAHAHIARMRTGHLSGELASQVSALCLASHPNVLRIHGVCLEERTDAPPFCGLVQEYANDNLFDFIARHNAPHDENVQLSLLEIHNIFELLDPYHSGRVTQAAFVEGLAKHSWVTEKLNISSKVRKRDTLQYVWNYGTHNGCIMDPPAEYHHPFGMLDRKGAGSFDLQEMVLYYGPRELSEGKLAWPHRVAVVLAVAHGMHYLLEHGLVHGNLKSSNVAFVEGDGGTASGTWMLSRIAVMDFGMPHLRRGFALMPPFEMTTPAWVAPERLLDPTCVSPHGDVWSFGVIMWEILTGEVPWPGKSEHDLRELASVGKLQLPVLQKHFESAPAGYVDIMLKCMDPVALFRPNFHTVCEMIHESKSQWRAEYLPG